MTLTAHRPPRARAKRWTKSEYNHMVDVGGFVGQRVYLFRGEIIEMAAMGNPHAQSVMKVTDWLYTTLRKDFVVRIQLPMEVPGESMPEPDALVCTAAQNERKPHPDSALLVIEISESSLADDRDQALEYAAAQVNEYWIVDVNARCVEVYRDPAPDPSTVLGFKYQTTRTYQASESISPIAKPTSSVRIADLLP